MFLNLIQAVKSDKQIEHPVLGQLSCSNLQTAYQNCMGYIDSDSDQQKQCRTYYNLAIQCYSTKSDQEFYDYIEEKIAERRNLNQFLKQNKSKLPELQQQHIQQTFNFFNAIDQQEKQQESEIQSFYQKQQQQNKKFI